MIATSGVVHSASLLHHYETSQFASEDLYPALDHLCEIGLIKETSHYTFQKKQKLVKLLNSIPKEYDGCPYGYYEFLEQNKQPSSPPNSIYIGGDFKGNLSTGDSANQSFATNPLIPDANKQAPDKKSKITIGDIVKVITGIVTITLAFLKGCGVI